MNLHTKTKQYLSRDYEAAFKALVLSSGTARTAALYEGSEPGGGYAVPITVAGETIALAPQDSAVRRLATVVPTTGDVRFPAQTTPGTVSIKPESGASASNFVDSSPAIGAFTLSAFLAGGVSTLSFEIAEDVPLFQAFLLQDASNVLLSAEEALYVAGTGIGEAQGMIGNVGAGVVEEPDASGNLVSIEGVWDLIASLKEKYLRAASFLMARSTANLIRKAQSATSAYDPAFTRDQGQDYLFGYPCEFSAAMPTAARGAAPILFGDFASGYLIGDRGGPSMNVKVLDQALATSGQLQVMNYRRTDGRVRLPEAIQQYTIAAS